MSLRLSLNYINQTTHGQLIKAIPNSPRLE